MSEAEETIVADEPAPSVFARYTRFVHSTKVGLGIIAVFLIGLILFYPLFRQQYGGVRIALNASSTKEPAPTMMTNAHFQGLDKDNQPYGMTAKSASEVGDNKIDLDQPAGEITLKGGQHISVNALTGVFDKKEYLLNLKGKINIFDDRGYALRTDTLLVDIVNKTAATHSEVHGQGALGTLKAYGGAMADGINQLIVFEGPVFVTLNMTTEKPASGESPK